MECPDRLTGAIAERPPGEEEETGEEETGEEEEEGIRKFNILTLLLFNRAGRVLPSPSYKKLCHLPNFSVNLEMKH